MKLFLMQATHDSPTGRKVCRHKKSSVIAFIQTSSLLKGNLDSRVRESFACESHQRLKSDFHFYHSNGKLCWMPGKWKKKWIIYISGKLPPTPPLS